MEIHGQRIFIFYEWNIVRFIGLVGLAKGAQEEREGDHKDFALKEVEE